MDKLIKIYVVITVIALLCLGGAPAFADWTVINLNPAGAEGSCANGVSGGQQVGYAWFSGNYHAGRWSGTAASWAELNPAGANWSKANGVSGGQQVGWAFQATYPPYEPEGHAILWNGSAGSWVDLHPAGAIYSKAYGVSGSQQVGWATFGGRGSAALWSGSAGSWVDLNPGGPYPGGSFASCATGVSGGQQVGWAHIGSDGHAILWSGTAASWVDLNPAGATYSGATGISGGQQVGNAWFVQFGGVNHAGLWRGTAESWVDLNPALAISSSATGVSGGKQVGYAMIGGNSRASLWSGTAASWVDLHALLPAGIYTESSAYGIDVSAGDIWVTGIADNEAMLWHYAPPVMDIPTTIMQVSGDGQTAWADSTLPEPFVVHVLDQDGNPIEGVAVTFSVIEGGGFINAESTTTDADGLTEATLTLGPRPAGLNTVEVTVTGIATAVTFEAIARSLAEQSQDILDFTNDSIEGGTLTSIGSSKSAKNRVDALINMIEEAQGLIEIEMFAEAYTQLKAVYERIDGQSRPPDFVTGPAAPELATLILKLMGSLL